MHPIRRGVMPTDRVHRHPQQAQPRGNSSPQTPTVHLGRCDTASTCSPGSEREALHPLRRATPDPSRYTRYVAIHPIRRGAMPTDRVHRLPQQAQPRTIRPHRPQPSTSDAATQPRNTRPAPNERRYTRYVALHPTRRATPVTSRYTRSEGVQCLRIGCTAT